MDQGTRRIQDLLDNTTALDDLSQCLDREFKYLQNWSQFAYVLGVPADVIRTCNLYLQHSPTRKLFEYLAVTWPDLIIEQLRNALIKNKEKPRCDVYNKIKEFGSNEMVSKVITNNSESDILDKIALKLDSATKSSSNWKDLGKELGVNCDKLKLFEMYNNYNPTVALLRYLYATSQEQEHMSLGVIMEYLTQMNREDVLLEVRNAIRSKGIQCVNTLHAKDVFQLGSELLENTSQMLNRDTAGVDGWRVLARHLIDDHFIDDKDDKGIDIDIIKKLEPPQPQDIHSPTKGIIEWLAASKTETTIGNLVGALEKIKRNDAVGILISHFSRASEFSYEEPDGLSYGVQATAETSEHILRGNTRSFGLPASTTTFIGRNDEKTNLIAHLTGGEHQMVVLRAATGFGKTSLAIALSRDLIKDHADYTCIYVPSEGVFSLEELAVKILTTCGLPAPSHKEKDKVKELFKNLNRNCVLILDNIDHMFHASEAINTSSSSSNISEDFPWKQRKASTSSKKDEYQIFLKEVLESAPKLKILATTWEDFSSVTIKVRQETLPPLSDEDSEELLKYQCKSALGIELVISDNICVQQIIKCCSGIPLLLCAASVVVKDFGIDAGALRLASSPPEIQSKILSPETLPCEQRFNHCLGICFDRMDECSQKVLIIISVFPGTFTFKEAEIAMERVSDKCELEEGLSVLKRFSFLSYDQENKLYYLHSAIRSFGIHTAKVSSEWESVYNGARSRFVYYTFDILFGIENGFYSTNSKDAIKRYREQEENLREIARWCISDKLTAEPLRSLKWYIIQSFIQCSLVNIKLMKSKPLKMIMCKFSQLCQHVNTKHYCECLIYGGTKVILGCLCIPPLCHNAQREAVWCFNKAFEALNCGTSNTYSDKLKITAKSKTISDRAKTQLLIKSGKCLVRYGYKEDGFAYILKGIEIRENLFKESHNNKDQIMVAVGYNDLAGAYSYLSDSYGTAIQIRENKVLPVYAKHLGIHAFTASALSHLSHDYSALQRYDEALKACSTALFYRRMLLGEHQETARSLFDMGRILSEQGSDSCENPDKNFKEALWYHKEALSMRQHLLDTPEETIQTHKEIVCILRSLRREEEAREHENKIAELVKSIKKLDKPHLN